jgi:hypothetical protein
MAELPGMVPSPDPARDAEPAQTGQQQVGEEDDGPAAAPQPPVDDGAAVTAGGLVPQPSDGPAPLVRSGTKQAHLDGADTADKSPAPADADARDPAAELCRLLLEAPFEAMRSGKGELAQDAFDEPAAAALELLGLPLEYDKDEEGGPWTVTCKDKYGHANFRFSYTKFTEFYVRLPSFMYALHVSR